MRLTAGSWLLAAALVAVVQAPRAQAAPPVAGRQPGPRAAAAGARPGDTEARRREEIDAVQRQDVAEALKKHFNIDVDWRTTPLDQLIDIRVRAAKAADLQARLGVSVEWQRYSWIELEALRRTLLSFEQYRNGQAPAPPAGPPSEPSPSPAQSGEHEWAGAADLQGAGGRPGRAVERSRRHHPTERSPGGPRRARRRAIRTASSGRPSRSGRAGRRRERIRMG